MLEKLPEPVIDFFSTVSLGRFPPPSTQEKAQPWKKLWQGPAEKSPDGRLLVVCPRIAVYGMSNRVYFSFFRLEDAIGCLFIVYLFCSWYWCHVPSKQNGRIFDVFYARRNGFFDVRLLEHVGSNNLGGYWCLSKEESSWRWLDAGIYFLKSSNIACGIISTWMLVRKEGTQPTCSVYKVLPTFWIFTPFLSIEWKPWFLASENAQIVCEAVRCGAVWSKFRSWSITSFYLKGDIRWECITPKAYTPAWDNRIGRLSS